ncbi:Transcription factor TFIIIB component B'' [Hondaea fermentalgiana]|uniref:Transcription factor TFIIIB component B n=1 Tax=Hondaea fermentalgiana TaxID=2315210 RepID=A0A2R5GKF6_9STRA|nr:Transcription factor TFIIIB component B'' [Hondaea fermentalgiana]|eukprot:GBG31105.1 Transcription factor TFIIIB component B'' [Hondaea fermentalgiana]
MRAKRAEMKRLRAMGIDPQEAERKIKEDAERAKAEAEREAAKPRAPKATIKNGKLVLDEESIVWRPKVQEVNELAVQDDEGHRITSQSYSKRQGGPRWTEEETRIFYMALRQCGQDFSMIAAFFPKRTRKQIAKKYKREERQRPDLVERALDRSIALPLEMEALEPNLLKDVQQFEAQLEKRGMEPAATLEDAINNVGFPADAAEDGAEEEGKDATSFETDGNGGRNEDNDEDGDEDEDEEDEDDDDDGNDDLDSAL